MKTTQLVLLAGLFMALTFSACETQEVTPTASTQPDSHQDGGTGNGGNTNGNSTPGTPGQNPAPGLGAMLVQMDQVSWRFDAQKRLVGYDSYYNNDEYTVVYEGDRAVKMLFETGHHLVYNWEGNQVVSAAMYWKDTEVRHFQFTYRDGKLVKKLSSNWYPDYPQGWLTVEEYEYDKKGNLLTLSSRAAQSGREEDLGPASFVTWGNYDDKVNPMRYAQSDIYLPGVKLFENNPGYRQTGYKEIFTYHYHESGLPMTRYTKLDSHPHVAPFVTTYQYQ